jgi:hypothetical protein
VAISGGPTLLGDGKQERWPLPTRPNLRLFCPFFRLELHELSSISSVRHGDDSPGSRGPTAEVEHTTLSPSLAGGAEERHGESLHPLSLPCSSSGVEERHGGLPRMITVDPLPPYATRAVCSLSSSAPALASVPLPHLIGAPLFPLGQLPVDLVAGHFGDGS